MKHVACILVFALAAGCGHGVTADPAVINFSSEGGARPLEETLDRAQGNCLQNQKTATWFLALSGSLGVAAGSTGISTLAFESTRSKQGAAIASVTSGVLAAGFAAGAAGMQTRYNEKHCPEIMGYSHGVLRQKVHDKFGEEATKHVDVLPIESLDMTDDEAPNDEESNDDEQPVEGGGGGSEEDDGPEPPIVSLVGLRR
ncbi:MAG: hypothetical protein ACRBN8_40590 [Nannocystales bacterium]